MNSELIITKHDVLGTDVIIVDNFISTAFQEFISNDLDPKRLPVQLLTSSAWENEDHIPAAVLMAFDSGNIAHGSYWYLLPMLLESLASIDKQLEDLIRIRVGVYFSNGLGVSTRNNKHVDKQFPHQVALYYPDDVDGSTYIFAGEHSDEVLLSVTPKQGRMLFMDGSLWHCSSNPTTKPLRTTINFNFTTK